MEAPLFSLCLPAYNEEAWLPRSLAAARVALAEAAAAGFGPAELIVCDNNSTDRTAEVARAEGAQVVFEPVNQISRARNAAAAAARGRYLVFLDSDTLLPGGLLIEALRRLESGQVAGGGGAVAFDQPVAPGPARILRWWNRFAQKSHTAAGSFIYCRADAFRAFGGFSRDVFAGEEIFFTRALKRWAKPRGMRFEVIPAPPVITSARKAEWYSPAQLYGFMVVAMCFPFIIRFRSLCGIWYSRPKAG